MEASLKAAAAAASKDEALRWERLQAEIRERAAHESAMNTELVARCAAAERAAADSRRLISDLELRLSALTVSSPPAGGDAGGHGEESTLSAS